MKIYNKSGTTDSWLTVTICQWKLTTVWELIFWRQWMGDSFSQVSFNNKSFQDRFKSLTLQIRHQPSQSLFFNLMDLFSWLLLFNVYDYVFGFCLSPEFAITNSRNLLHSISAWEYLSNNRTVWNKRTGQSMGSYFNYVSM